jgi:hypothetical protein
MKVSSATGTNRAIGPAAIPYLRGKKLPIADSSGESGCQIRAPEIVAFKQNGFARRLG